jgi:hypothetical protein
MPRELVLRRIKEMGVVGGGPGILLHLGLQFDVSPEVVTRRLLYDLSLFSTSIILFKEETTTTDRYQIPLPKPYRGSDIASLRKREAKVYADVKQVMGGKPPYSSLEKLRDQNSDVVSMLWRYDTTSRSSRLIVWLNFNRDRALESILLVPKDTLPRKPR